MTHGWHLGGRSGVGNVSIISQLQEKDYGSFTYSRYVITVVLYSNFAWVHLLLPRVYYS
jgi:hypothetical protein